MSRKVRKEEKPHGGTPPPRKDKAQNFNNTYEPNNFYHFNVWDELILYNNLINKL